MKASQCPLSHGEKQRMIAEAAYYRAEKRGFAGGDPLEDWRAAEAEVERALMESCTDDPRGEERDIRRKLWSEVRDILGKAEDTLNAAAIKQALDKATKELRGVGEHVPEKIDQASKAVKQELAETITRLGQEWEDFRVKKAELYEDLKDRGMEFVQHTTQSIKSWADRQRKKDE